MGMLLVVNSVFNQMDPVHSQDANEETVKNRLWNIKATLALAQSSPHCQAPLDVVAHLPSTSRDVDELQSRPTQHFTRHLHILIVGRKPTVLIDTPSLVTSITSVILTDLVSAVLFQSVGMHQSGKMLAKAP